MVDKNYQIYLFKAILRRDLEAVENVLQQNLPINFIYDESYSVMHGLSPFTQAAYYGDENMVQLLLHYGADVNAANDKGYTPLISAAKEGNSSMVKLLLRYRADIHRRNNGGSSALHLATWFGYSDLVKVLVENGANLNQMNKWQETPLMIARARNHHELYDYITQREGK